MTGDPVTAALADLDARLVARGLDLWIGGEPTFTLASSTEPCWTWQADDADGEKLDRAVALVRVMSEQLAVRSVHRVIGRQYPDEETRRFCLGVVFGWAGEPRPPWGAEQQATLAAALAALATTEPGAAPALRASRPLRAGDDGWLTVTPDPGVVEVNSAPCPDGAAFLQHVRAIYAAAARAGLAPQRLRYNGEVGDSGGGGQLTLGGPTAEASPFFVHPALLPRLVRYLNDHPALSYWFLGDCAGAASQAPRADEGVRERWEELRLAVRTLERLAARDEVTPALLWGTLAPLLVDASGNSHRAELNVEKLWNPHLPERGKLGLVELRAFQMPATPEQLAAAAALVRAVAARCALAPYDGPAGDAMIDWSAALHERMALPCLLRDDLDDVLRDLHAHDVGLAPVLEDLVRSYRQPRLWQGAPWPDVTVELSRALEFWPLLGDTASQEGRTSRMVDASSERLELRVEVPRGRPVPTISAGGRAIAPMRAPAPPDAARETWLVGVRRRVYLPDPGLHPAIAALDPLELLITDGTSSLALRLYGWKPDGGPYDGVPVDAAEATRRRAARLTVSTLVHDEPPATGAAAAASWLVDLRDPA